MAAHPLTPNLESASHPALGNGTELLGAFYWKKNKITP
jgi:hypothetical protein